MEPTSACNIYCQGCYRANVKDGHKPMTEVEHELDVFARYRSFDGVSIAGGDPLTHPDVVRIVEATARRGYKPIVNTNGVALTDQLLRDLKNAGVFGFTFHIDSKQGRPNWKKKTELDLNELRLEFAERLAKVGGISCAFNATVYEDTLSQVPGVVEWAERHIDKVHVVVFIAFRQASETFRQDHAFVVGDQTVSLDDVVYARPTGEQRLDITSRDIVGEIRKTRPDFSPCAYLNGTEKMDSLKWLLTTYFGTKEKVFGYAGPRFMELSQSLHHLRTGKYMAYASPKTMGSGRAITAAASGFDEGVRGSLAAYLKDAVRHPWNPFPRLHVQSVMVIQPIDVVEGGRLSMCDACPDMTVYEDELVWSCRLEERIKYGAFATRTVERKPLEEEASPQEEPVPVP